MFCPECGIDHHAGDREQKAALDREVEIARINANRDIEVAKVTARTAVAVAETDNAITAAHAEGKAEGMETAIEGGAVDGQGDELGELDDGAPIIVESEPPPEEPPGPDMAPPVLEVPTPRRSSGGGWWAGYH